MSDIVKRLRNFAIWNNRHSHYEPVPLCKEAADRIEELEARLFKCKRCGCELNDEVAMVDGEEWCHPCADEESKNEHMH